MKTPSKHLLAGAVATLLASLAGTTQADVLPADLVAEIKPLGDTWEKNSVVVAAVETQNAQGMSHETILELDEKWRDLPEKSRNTTAAWQNNPNVSLNRSSLLPRFLDASAHLEVVAAAG